MNIRANTHRADEIGVNGVVGWLEIELKELKAQSLLPSEQRVLERLLARKLECHNAFSELEKKLECYQWQAYLSALISTAAFWNPKATDKLREVEKELHRLNKEIAEKAVALAEDLKNRSELCNSYGFTTDDTYHVVDLIAQASARNGHYQLWVHEKLQSLRGQFDLKYWPSVDEIVSAIGNDSHNSTVSPTDNITRESISSRKSSTRDFLRALSEAIRENSESMHAFVPDKFRLPARSIASLVNCSLDLDEDQCIDETLVKSTRRTQQGDFRA